MAKEAKKKGFNPPPEELKGGGTMYRVVYTMHLSQTQIADHKAHLMIAINTLLLSFVVTKHKMGVLAHMPGLLIPNILLSVLCVTCIVLASMAAKPGAITKTQKVPGKPVNWLYFGDFSNYSLQEFDKNVHQLIRDRKMLNEAMSRDVYFMGLSLARKYKYLSWCYSVFYFGLLLVIATFVAFVIFGKCG